MPYLYMPYICFILNLDGNNIERNLKKKNAINEEKYLSR